VSLITVLVVAALTLLLIWAARREKPTADPVAGTLLFQHSGTFRGISIALTIMMVLFLMFLIFRVPIKTRQDVLALLGLFGFCLIPPVPLLWESFRYALIVSPKGLDCRSPWRGRRFLHWKDVEQISYSPINSWFIIRARDGWKFHVGIFVPGLGRFLQTCERHLKPSALAKAKLGYAQVGRTFPESTR